MRSDNVKKGAERAPNRSLFYAMGYTKEELERPLIGVVSAKSEIVPGHIHLDKVAEGRQYAPEYYEEYVIEGGNHAQFGFYGRQKGDGIASITPQLQIQETIGYITEFTGR